MALMEEEEQQPPMEEPFSIEVGDIIRHKEYPVREYEVLEKGRSDTNFWYRLRFTDGRQIADAQSRMVWRDGRATIESYFVWAESAILYDCEKWAMKKVKHDGN